MRAIITGGSGFLGQVLSADLAKDGHEVIVLSRDPAAAGRRLPSGVRAVAWDGRTAEGWGALADGAGAVFNLAGENLSAGRWTAARKKRILDSRTNAGKAVVEAIQAARHAPPVLLQASAIGYYGPGDQPVDETSPAGSDFQAQVCRAWEGTIRPGDIPNTRLVIFRSGVALHPSGGALQRLLLPFRLYVGGPIGSGRQWFSWVARDEWVSMARFALAEERVQGAINAVDPQPLRMAEFTRALGKAMGRPSWMPVPGFVLRLAFGEMADVLLTGQQVIPRRLQELRYPFRYNTAEQALRAMLTR